MSSEKLKENIECQAAKALLDSRLAALKARFPDKYSEFLNQFKDESKAYRELFTFVMKMMTGVAEGWAYHDGVVARVTAEIEGESP